ncbi:M3 family metallopeptidase [Bradyrhizobium sp. vgs-9]|uniref:M3 family metallopeptidase n=1 Tax=Bradyrhizobium sp. vgs-9 TaxID=208389 RepID=UPI0035D44019
MHFAVSSLENDIATLIEQLDDAIHGDPPHVSRIARAYSNLAYMRGYCDANARLFERCAFRCWCELRSRDPAVLSSLERSVAIDDREEELRQTWLGWLSPRINDAAGFAVCEDYRNRATDHLKEAELAQGEVLERLRLRGNASTPASIAMFSAMSRINGAATRTKLMRAWQDARVGPLDAVVGLIDRALVLRRDHVQRQGFKSVLDHTLSRGGVDESRIASFLEAYADAALEAHQELSARVAAEVDDQAAPLLHFPRYLAIKAKGASVAIFEFGRCLEFLLTTFVEELTVRGHFQWRGQLLDIVISKNGRRCGLITIDRADAGLAPPLIAPQEPWARVLRRTQTDDSGREVMSFDAVQSLFHEFGHALVYVLSNQPCPSASGVDCLPAERLEQMSTWSELWAFQDRLGAQVGVEDELLEQCRMIRAVEFMRGRLERVATAMLDFELHRSNDEGLRGTLERLARMRPGIFVLSTTDLAHHFVTLSFADNPGASFAYLWGGAVAIEAHGVKATASVDGKASGRSILSGVVTTPAIAPAFEFYRTHAQWGQA